MLPIKQLCVLLLPCLYLVCNIPTLTPVLISAATTSCADIAPQSLQAQLTHAAHTAHILNMHLQEAKLKQWQTPQRPSSSLDTFAASSGYKQMAADAMARVRARLSGWEDDDSFATTTTSSSSSSEGSSREASSVAETTAGDSVRSSSSSRLSPAAQQALQELLVGCSCREERATVLPEAFMPPGLQVGCELGI
jgi:hypothetical protein